MADYNVTVIKPRTHLSLADELSDAWEHRELLWVFASRSIAVRYKQSVLGLAWVVLQPVMTTAIFTIVFSYFARIPSEDIPYPVFVFSGLLLWQYLSRVIVEGAGSLLANANIITKIYFPRLLVPLSVAIAGALDFAIAMVVLVVLMFILGVFPKATILLVPLLLVISGLLGYGIALVLAPLNAVHRDVGLALPFVMQFGMYLSPIIYPVSFVPEKLQWLFVLNPAATLLNAMRWAMIGKVDFPGPVAWALVFVYTALLLLIGRAVFRTMESTLVDRI